MGKGVPQLAPCYSFKISAQTAKAIKDTAEQHCTIATICTTRAVPPVAQRNKVSVIYHTKVANVTSIYYTRERIYLSFSLAFALGPRNFKLCFWGKKWIWNDQRVTWYCYESHQ